MNKKFLSAILFGALMATSAGTFVSCKDYDDDIKGLQTQIDTNKTAIAELQKLVGAGKWVSSISSIENGFTVTMSDGSSHQIKGINGKDGADGKDGKNGAEWTIGEDGFWYVDGEKTENVAVGKNGENGVTAPAPAISENGMWVVYSWDEAKGEFVAEETEIPAAGTSAYAVKANGVYTLFIADENGELQEIALPATCDAFVATSPVAIVNVLHQEAKWTKVTGDAKKLFAKLAAEFPEIEDYEKGQLMKQGGNLPVIISPANLELTNEFKFSLQDVKGKVSEAVVSNPVKGMPEAELVVNGLGMITRSANSNDCFWTLNVEPAKNKKGTAYVDVDEAHALVIENEKGTVVKTAFAYYVNTENVGNVDVEYKATGKTIKLAEEIDVLAKAYDLNGDNVKDEAIFTIANGMNGHYVLEVNKVDAEKYDITVNGSKLTIGNIPSDQNTLSIRVNLIALGLNGTVDQSEIQTLTIDQEIAATGALEHAPIVLNAETAKNKVRWNIDDLGLSTVQLDEFMNATTKKVYISYVNDNDQVVQVEGTRDVNGNLTTAGTEITVYKADGTTSNVDYSNAAKFGINLNPKYYEPREYDVRLEVIKGTSVIYVAEGTLAVENPTTTAIKLAPAFVDENGVLQITGNPLGAKITYDLETALVLKNANVYFDYTDVETGAAGAFVDMDATDEDPAWTNANGDLSIDKYNYTVASKQKLYKERNFKVRYYMFGNKANWSEFEFKAQVVSEVYSATPADVISLTAARLTTAFGAINKPVTSGEDKIDESLIDFTQITKAVYAAGTNAGKEYKLWGTAGKDAVGPGTGIANLKEKTDYSTYADKDGYLINASGLPVEITKSDLLKIGMKMEHYMALDKDAKFYWTKATQTYEVDGKTGYLSGWSNIWGQIKDFCSYNQTGSFTLNTGLTAETLTEQQTKIKGLFDAYYSSFKYTGKVSVDVYEEAKQEVLAADGKVTSVVFGFVNGKEEAEKYVKTTINADGTMQGTSLTAKSQAPNDVVGGQVIVPMYIKITDAWGMIMKHEFNVTIKTVQE